MRLPWLACIVCHSFFTIFWFPFRLWLALPRDWTLLDGGLCFSLAYPFSCYPLLPYYSIIPAMKSFASILLGLFGPAVLFFSQWPSTAIGPFITSLAGSYVPFVFPWASWARLLSLGFLDPFLNFAFPWAFTKSFRLPWPNYIIPYPWGLWARHQPLTFFTFITLGLSWLILAFPHHILPWFAFSLFSGSFEPIYLLKAHLFIL